MGMNRELLLMAGGIRDEYKHKIVFKMARYSADPGLSYDVRMACAAAGYVIAATALRDEKAGVQDVQP